MRDEALRDLLASVRTIAVLGAKDKPGQAVDRVGRYLMAAGYEVIPVHPARSGVWGLPTYQRLADIPKPVDMVNLFRAPEHCLAHAEECLALDALPRVFWMQLCISNAEARALLAPKGVTVIEDLCLMVEHARVFTRPLPEGAQTACPLPLRAPR